jgi:hypothetical protein
MRVTCESRVLQCEILTEIAGNMFPVSGIKAGSWTNESALLQAQYTVHGHAD